MQGKESTQKQYTILDMLKRERITHDQLFDVLKASNHFQQFLENHYIPKDLSLLPEVNVLPIDRHEAKMMKADRLKNGMVFSGPSRVVKVGDKEYSQRLNFPVDGTIECLLSPVNASDHKIVFRMSYGKILDLSCQDKSQTLQVVAKERRLEGAFYRRSFWEVSLQAQKDSKTLLFDKSDGKLWSFVRYDKKHKVAERYWREPSNNAQCFEKPETLKKDRLYTFLGAEYFVKTGKRTELRSLKRKKSPSKRGQKISSLKGFAKHGLLKATDEDVRKHLEQHLPCRVETFRGKSVVKGKDKNIIYRAEFKDDKLVKEKFIDFGVEYQYRDSLVYKISKSKALVVYTDDCHKVLKGLRVGSYDAMFRGGKITSILPRGYRFYSFLKKLDFKVFGHSKAKKQYFPRFHEALAQAKKNGIIVDKVNIDPAEKSYQTIASRALKLSPMLMSAGLLAAHAMGEEPQNLLEKDQSFNQIEMTDMKLQRVSSNIFIDKTRSKA